MGKVKFGVSQCGVNWFARFEKGSHGIVLVRLRLRRKTNVHLPTLKLAARRWRKEIKDIWTPTIDPTRPYRIEPIWVNSDEDYKILVWNGSRGATLTNWRLNQPKGVAAHEFGHMLGNVDEYALPCRAKLGQGTIMESLNGQAVPRHLHGIQFEKSNSIGLLEKSLMDATEIGNVVSSQIQIMSPSIENSIIDNVEIDFENRHSAMKVRGNNIESDLAENKDQVLQAIANLTEPVGEQIEPGGIYLRILLKGEKGTRVTHVPLDFDNFDSRTLPFFDDAAKANKISILETLETLRLSRECFDDSVEDVKAETLDAR